MGPTICIQSKSSDSVSELIDRLSYSHCKFSITKLEKLRDWLYSTLQLFCMVNKIHTFERLVRSNRVLRIYKQHIIISATNIVTSYLARSFEGIDLKVPILESFMIRIWFSSCFSLSYVMDELYYQYLWSQSGPEADKEKYFVPLSCSFQCKWQC